ncbi:iron-siderophore ABC transporter substrate-binding protein [Microbacterium sp. STN6]|uniref:iron-siderophore ABC transporter substrate-binding protein n=1 Tax=Microbacterium sp. STN6 TaxID=2995588 RepID=UPI002260C8DB|nr:iron-siderophore ABC transporter substrate-binding protein [Microbacterium sp. STN6]MCX7521835.1 iron-siderophore ABC transporter substrate-binding protein [Microbacterium sp. STN6]
MHLHAHSRPAARPRPAGRRRLALAAAAILSSAALALTGCSAGGSDGAANNATNDAAADSSAFPVTIHSALGDATIDKRPTRVATWGWSSQDAALALGVVPVAMPAFTYGGNDKGILPWDAEAISTLGGTAPKLLDGGDTGQVPFEQFVAAKPDVILAPYSGITKEDFATLSKIAPVVAYPDQPWATSWQDQMTIIGKALGKADAAKKLITKTDADVSALAAKYPVLRDKTFVYASANEADQLNVFRATDPRVQLLNQLGLKNSPSVKALDTDPKAGSYFYQVSYENVGRIDTDILVAYFDNQKAADAFTADPLIAAMPAVKEGRFAPIVGESFVMASSAPTVLSIPWMLDRYVPKLAAAADKVQ